MSKHYHVMFGSSNGTILSEIPYDNYEESLVDLVHFTSMLYGNLDQAIGQLSFEKAVEATDHGDGKSVYIGTDHLCVFWHACDGNCQSPHLN